MKSPDSKARPIRIGWILAGVFLWAVLIGVFYHFASQNRDRNLQPGNGAAVQNVSENQSDGDPPDGDPPEGDSADGDSVSADDGDIEPEVVTIRLPARPLPDFELTEVSGRKVTLADLKGRRWVASFVFSSCTLTCPEITRNLSKLRERLRATDNDVLFVSISVLPEVDTPEKFGNWADVFRDEDDENWWFLTGDKDVIYNLMRSYFLQYVKEHTKGTVPPGMEVAHSNRVILVNEDAIPVATYLAVNDADLVRLRRVLTGREEFPSPGPAADSDAETPSTDASRSPAATDQESPDDSAEAPAEQPQSSADPAREAVRIAWPRQQSRTGLNTAWMMPLATLSIAESGLASFPSVKVAKEEPASADSGTDLPDPNTDAAAWNSRIEGLMPRWVQRLPPANAGLNLTALVLLLTGYRAIRRRQIATHRALMISAFAVSIVFLANYLTYHWALNHYAGVRFRAFTGPGVWALLYRLILWPHVVMAALVPILAIVTLWHAFRGRLEQHRRIARITFPVWVFVSVSGVVVYGMLNHWPV